MKLALACAAVMVFVPSPARAEHPRVQLDLDPCIADGDEVRRIVAIELGTLLASPSDPPSPRTRVTASCGSVVLYLVVDDPITGKSISRTVDQTESPERARPRLLALAIVELVTASWNELQANAPPPPPPSPRVEVKPVAVVQKPPPSRPPWVRLRLLAEGGGLSFFSRPAMLGGGGLRLTGDHAKHLGWMIDVQAHHGTDQVALGSISADVVSVGTALLLHKDWSRVAVRGGLGLRGGAVRLSGAPKDPQSVVGGTFWGPWLGPLALVGVGVSATRRLALELSVEAGYVALPVGGLIAGARQVKVDGAWIDFQVGIGIFL